MWIIVGLGNPGEEYVQTYHNVGFSVVGRIASAYGVRVKERCGPALVSGRITVGGHSAGLVMPQTYMNSSGAVLPAVFERFDSSASEMIVIYDDIALPLGKVRVRQKGSAGGHNGIKSIISALKSDEFLRIRIGIMPERQIGDTRDFVLSQVGKTDRALLNQTEEIGVKAVEGLIGEGLEKTMAAFNGVDLREV